ncbi:MAG: nitroreductase family protein [Deltaproteobacteria bacterium]|nr:nitroreductase family protein [Deltaproteobacteria bacterium]
MSIIQMDHEGGYPRLIPDTEEVCLRCGHCVAVCPNGALRHTSIPMERCPSIVKDLAINREQTVQFLRSRRSVRIKKALNGMVDLTLALSYLELAAPTLGLGTCWAGLLQGALHSGPEIKEVLGLPENHPHHYPMMLGYAKPRYYRLPERKPPRIVWG